MKNCISKHVWIKFEIGETLELQIAIARYLTIKIVINRKPMLEIPLRT